MPPLPVSGYGFGPEHRFFPRPASPGEEAFVQALATPQPRVTEPRLPFDPQGESSPGGGGGDPGAPGGGFGGGMFGGPAGHDAPAASDAGPMGVAADVAGAALGLAAPGLGTVASTLGNMAAHANVQEAYGFDPTHGANFGKSLAHALSFGMLGQSPAEAQAAMEDPDDVGTSPQSPNNPAPNPDDHDDSGMNAPGSGVPAPGSAPFGGPAAAAGPMAPNATQSPFGMAGGLSGAPGGAGPGAGPAGPAGPATGSSAAAVDANNNEGGTAGGTGDGEGGDGKVICSAMYHHGLIPREVYRADQEFAKELPLEVMAGYHLWAMPLARLMREKAVAARLIAPLAKPWAYEIAHRAGVPGVKGHVIGKIYLKLGVPTCLLLGKLTRTHWPAIA